ncbi:MAG: ATP-dependent DNA helicase [Desulfobacula sp.]|jgi:DNA helicase-2/ATP-dependent DNA helicase PcrA
MNPLHYSEKQLDAIKSNDKHLRIIACAGSGKTSTIVGKIDYLLNPQNGYRLAPKNIIAFTYTEKAAGELKNKVLNQVSLKGMADMYIGTIHGWCLKALQENEYKYQNFSVLDEIKLKLFIDKYFEVIGMKDVTKLSDPNVYLKRFINTSIFVRIMDIIRESNFIKEVPLPSNLKNAKQKYEETLLQKKHFDFSMIMDKALESLNQESNLTKSIKENIKFLFVDEYQDINPIQEKLINKIWEISDCKIIVVGDDDQNIYQWRGSNNRYIIDFNKKFSDSNNMEDIRLDINYRSSEGITKLAESIISHNQIRIKNKKMSSAKKQIFIKSQDLVYTEYATIEEENEAIAEYINNILGVKFSDEDEENRGISYSDICILLRTWNKAQTISESLDRYNIPFITAGVNQLFDTIEVQAATGIFQFLRGDISKDDLSILWMAIPNANISKDKLNLAIEGDTSQRINGLNGMLPENEKVAGNWEYSLQDIFWNFLENAEIYEDSFIDNSSEKKEQETAQRAEIVFYNFGKFSQVINDFEEINFNSNNPSFHLFNFLSFIRYAAIDYYPEGWLNNTYKTPNAVQIMTIHQAKGLEFPVVIIPGLNRNYLPAKKKGGLNEWHFLDRSLIEEQNRYEGDKIDYEDERRLLYVAITRSQKYLFLSRSPDLNNRLYTKESLFVQELLQPNVLVDGRNLSFPNSDKIEPKAKEKVKNIILDFTTLKDYFECPYRFKLVSMYGFCFPLNQRMGVGRSFHNCLMELHKRLKKNETLTQQELEGLINRQTFFPYLTKSVKLSEPLYKKVSTNVVRYYEENRQDLTNIEFVEQDIQYKLGDNILVLGRVDLIKKRKDFGKYETTIVEFKSSEDRLSGKITDEQLKMYALGHRELTGEVADYIMTYIIGEAKRKVPYALRPEDLNQIEARIKEAAEKIRNENFRKISSEKKHKCESCYPNRLCLNRRLYNVKSNI